MQLSVSVNTVQIYKSTFLVKMEEPHIARDYLSEFRSTFRGKKGFGVGLDDNANTILVVFETTDVNQVSGGMTTAELKRVTRQVVSKVDNSYDLTASDIAIIGDIKKQTNGAKMATGEGLRTIYKTLTGVTLSPERAEKLKHHYR
jgi:hypothetical protein